MLSLPFPPEQKQPKKRFLTLIVIVLFLAGLLLGGFIGYAVTYDKL